MTPPRSAWQPLTEADLPRLDAIARSAHPDLPERLAVLAEKRRLCPEACRKLVLGGEMIGYALAHPWRLFDIPRLDAFLRAVPPDADCLYLHDIAVLPQGRGGGATSRYMEHLRTIAREKRLGALACVSVYGTSPLWRSFGFEIIVDQRLEAALAGYDQSATYMVARASAPA